MPVHIGPALDPEDAGHGWQQRSSELKLIDAHETPTPAKDAIIMMHGQHEASSEAVAVDEGHGGHGKSQEAPEKGVQAILSEAGRAHGQLQVKTVAVELCDTARCYDNARLVIVAELDLVEGREHGGAERRRYAVVGGRGDGEEVDLRRGRGADYGAADVVGDGRDGDCEERGG